MAVLAVTTAPLAPRWCAVGTAVRRAVGDEAPGSVEKETAQPRCAVCPQAFWVRCLYMQVCVLFFSPPYVAQDVAEDVMNAAEDG